MPPKILGESIVLRSVQSSKVVPLVDEPVQRCDSSVRSMLFSNVFIPESYLRKVPSYLRNYEGKVPSYLRKVPS